MPNSPENDTQATPATNPQHRENEQLAAELEQIEDRYKRALADLDNYRKRAARDTQTQITAAQETIIHDWLDIVDTVERALHTQPNQPCHDTLNTILDQINTILTRQGIHRTGTPGEPFDPEQHDAIAVHHTPNAPDRTILTVQRPGYTLNNRIIRPAQVVVAQPPHTTN